MHSHEFYDLDSLNAYEIKSFILPKRYMKICAVVREKAFIGCSPKPTGNRRASDEHHFNTPKYKVARQISLIHQ